MSCNQDQNEANKAAPIIHVRADSDSCLEELFTFGLKPQPMNQTPLRMRKLPQSFFNPPQSGSKSPSCHSRESSFDSSSLHQQQPYSPMQSVGSPQPQGPGTPNPIHTRAHSSPANLQQTLAAVQLQQQQQQQHFHIRQQSCDVSGANDLGPLPPGWEPARTPQGVMYFMNHITKTTQWEDPRLQIQDQNMKEQQLSHMTNSLPQTAQQKQLMLSRPLPHGWEQAVTPEGEAYFINHISKSTSWFDPRMPINSQSLPVRIGQAQVQQQQQLMRLQRLENERRVLQQRQAELEKMEQNRLMRHNMGARGGFHENIQAAVNATQEMLMRQNLNGDGTPSPQGIDQFHGGLGHRPVEMQHIREESADSGLGMGSNFNLGSIPEDISGMETLDSMDTDLNTTLTDPATPTPTTILIGCGIQQQQQQVVDSNSMDSSETMIPNLQADLGDDFQNDLMQSILTSQNQQANPSEGTLTWL